MNTILKSFREGFLGAFMLTGAIVMAIVSVASAFTHGRLGDAHHKDGSTQM